MPIDITSVSDLVSKSVPLGDNESVRVFKNGDVSISGNMDLSGVKTIIVENGNLIITMISVTPTRLPVMHGLSKTEM